MLEMPPRDVPLHIIRNRISVGRRSFRDWLRAFRECPADACIYEKGTLRSGYLALDLAARYCFQRFITIEQLEPPAMPAKASRYLGGLVGGVGIWWYPMLASGYVRSLAAAHGNHRQRFRQKIAQHGLPFPRPKWYRLNGADIERFRPNPDARRRTREGWGVNPDTLVFGSVRRFCWDKEIDLAIEAFARFREVHPGRDAALVLDPDGPERAVLERQAMARASRIGSYFPGFTSEPWTAYPGFDVFVMPSRSEALSLALVEAMASECVPIASHVGGSAEVISDRSLGWIVPPEDVQA